MLLLSVSPQHHTLFSVPRVSSSSSLSSSSRLPLLPKLTSSIFSRSTARRFPCALTFASKVRSMAELVEDKEAGVAVVASGSGEGTEESKGLNRSHTFLDARTEEALLAGIREETEAGRLPPNVASGMEELYQNYRNAVFQSGNPRADEIILSNMTVALDRIFLDVEDPFVFEPHHKALREPFDYYMFGQNYIRPLVDFRVTILS